MGQGFLLSLYLGRLAGICTYGSIRSCQAISQEVALHCTPLHAPCHWGSGRHPQPGQSVYFLPAVGEGREVVSLPRWNLLFPES